MTLLRTDRLAPIAYAYDAAYHCPDCAARRFGVSDEGWIPEDATDGEGNPVGVLAPWDEWYEYDEDGRQVLACDDCARVIDEYERGK